MVHLEHFQEEVNVKPPDAKALSDDREEEGDADDEEDGGEQDVDGGENQKLQKHYHLWNLMQINARIQKLSPCHACCFSQLFEMSHRNW